MNKSKNIGTAFESKVQNKIIDDGGIAFRLALNGNKDIGDILSIEKNGLHFVECKTRKGKALRSELEQWKRECLSEIANIKSLYGIDYFKFSLFYENRKTGEITEKIMKGINVKEDEKSATQGEKKGIQNTEGNDVTPEINKVKGATKKQKNYVYILLTNIAKKLLSTPKKILAETQVTAGLRVCSVGNLSFDEASIIIEELNLIEKEIVI